MAHALTTNQNGQVEFAYAGERPWHGLGQALAAQATVEEILRAANLMWTVSKRELVTTDGIMVDGWCATVRDDNNKPLGAVRSTYEVIQNSQAAATMESVIGTGEALYETAGSIFDGRQIFLVAKLPEVLRVGRNGNDVTEQFLTMVTGHDGYTPLRMFFTPIRVVCNNTLQMALSGMKQSVVLRHSGSIDEKIEAAKGALGIAKHYFVKYQEVASRLSAATVSAAQVESFLKEVFQVAKPKTAEVDLDAAVADEKISKVKLGQMDAVKDLFSGDRKNNLPGIKGTAWALLNATTQWADHSRDYNNANERLTSLLWGGAFEIKQRALNAAMALVK